MVSQRGPTILNHLNNHGIPWRLGTSPTPRGRRWWPSHSATTPWSPMGIPPVMDGIYGWENPELWYMKCWYTWMILDVTWCCLSSWRCVHGPEHLSMIWCAYSMCRIWHQLSTWDSRPIPGGPPGFGHPNRGKFCQTVPAWNSNLGGLYICFSPVDIHIFLYTLPLFLVNWLLMIPRAYNTIWCLTAPIDLSVKAGDLA